MAKNKEYTTEEMDKNMDQRTLSDAELIRGGAVHKDGRLEVTAEQRYLELANKGRINADDAGDLDKVSGMNLGRQVKKENYEFWRLFRIAEMLKREGIKTGIGSSSRGGPDKIKVIMNNGEEVVGDFCCVTTLDNLNSMTRPGEDNEDYYVDIFDQPAVAISKVTDIIKIK